MANRSGRTSCNALTAVSNWSIGDSLLIAPRERDLWEIPRDGPTWAAYCELVQAPIEECLLRLYRAWYDLAETAVYVSAFFVRLTWPTRTPRPRGTTSCSSSRLANAGPASSPESFDARWLRWHTYDSRVLRATTHRNRVGRPCSRMVSYWKVSISSPATTRNSRLSSAA